MSAAVVDLSEFAARRRPKAARLAVTSSAPQRHLYDALAVSDTSPVDFCFWQGASGQRYVHHVYSLIGCPQLPAVNYVMFARDSNGQRKVLRVGRTKHDSATLNLAEIRHRGAKLGATEVHVHFIAGTNAERRVIELDLCAGLLAAKDQREDNI